MQATNNQGCCKARFATMLPKRFLHIFAFASLLFFQIGCNSKSPNAEPAATLSQGKRALASGEFERAAKIADLLLEKNSDSVPCLMLAAEAATKLEHYSKAIELYKKIPDSKTGDAAIANWAVGEIYFHQGEASKSIEALRQAVTLNPKLNFAHSRLCTTLDTVGLRWDSRPHLLALLKSGDYAPYNLLFLGNIRKDTYSQTEIRRYLKSNPDDLLPTLAEARHLLAKGNLSEAKSLIVKLLLAQPDLVEAHVQLGLIMLQQSDLSSFGDYEKWNSDLPTAADQHPDVWYVRGRWYQPRDPLAALQCFRNAIELDCNHLPALQRLSQASTQSSHREIAALAATRSKLLQRLNIKLQQLYKEPKNVQYIKQAAELTFDLGRLWESFGWCRYAREVSVQLPSDTGWISELSGKISQSQVLNNSAPQTIVNRVPLIASLKSLPEVDLPKANQGIVKTENASTLPPQEVADSRIRLDDVAEKIGISFEYLNGQVNKNAGRLMHEVTGGGIGVVDFDRDGWCDLFLPQGENPTPAGEPV